MLFVAVYAHIAWAVARFDAEKPIKPHQADLRTICRARLWRRRLFWCVQVQCMVLAPIRKVPLQKREYDPMRRVKLLHCTIVVPFDRSLPKTATSSTDFIRFSHHKDRYLFRLGPC
jgi:hypothetical protein